MRKFFARLLKGLVKRLGEDEQEAISCLPEPQQEIEQESSQEIEETPIVVEENKKKHKKKVKEQAKTRGKKQKNGDIVTIDPRDIRDIMEVMEVPFLALSKNRTTPINYESADGTVKVKISRHSEHYVASIYDWDIVLFVASKMQEIMNAGSDIPPRSLIVPRHELLKALHKHDGKTNRKEIEASLARLNFTAIETTVRNEDYRYRGGFGFLDSWGYTERKDIKEFQITLSQWLYDGICRKGSLLKVDQRYFNITSGLKKFLYRTARKHVGTRNKSWKISLEILYQKSGSEQELRNFKHDLKKAVADNDIPGYFMNWIEEDRNTFVSFINKKESLKKVLS